VQKALFELNRFWTWPRDESFFGLRHGQRILFGFIKKSQFGSILEGLVMEDVGVFYGHLFYFPAI
jgi:hypothetical protein